MFPIVEMAGVLYVCSDVLSVVCTTAQCRAVPYMHGGRPPMFSVRSQATRCGNYVNGRCCASAMKSRRHRRCRAIWQTAPDGLL